MPVAVVRLVIGTIVGSHGVHGEIKLRLMTDRPDHLQTIKQLFIGDEETPRPLLGVRLHRGQALLRVEGVDSPEAVGALVGVPVRIAGSDAAPLAPGEFYLYQVIDLEAVNEAGETIGRVTDVIETGAHDVFVVRPAGGGPDLLLPHHPEVVLDIQPAAGRMIVRPLVYE
jgi:16S rRNA processing protein RimM